MATVIRKAVPADAQAVADIFNGFVTRHPTLNIKPSWTKASALQNITGENQFVIVMVVDKVISAFFVLFCEERSSENAQEEVTTWKVARVTASAWTKALEAVRPDPQFALAGWLGQHRADFGLTDLEAIWYNDNPFGLRMLRAATAGLLRPTAGDVGKATQITTLKQSPIDRPVVHMIATLETAYRLYNERKTSAVFWEGFYSL